VLEFLAENGLSGVPVRRLGIPDTFVEQGKRELLLEKLGLTRDGIIAACLEMGGKKRKNVPWLQSGNE
jgi:1-deoxy-D-xylulose-5-phosphate synthase